MVDLQSLQQSMARTLLGQAPDQQLQASIRQQGLAPEERLRIHRNNYRESLSDALLGLFPLCKAFVGEIFLKQALRHFVTEHPPTEAALYGYGRGVADFLQSYPAAETVPYLADVARLEWCTHELANADEAPDFNDLGAAQAALGSGEGLRLHDNARLLASSFPIYDLWRVATAQCPPEDLDAQSGGQAILLVLHQGQIFYQPLSEDVARLLAAIGRGDRLDFIHTRDLEELIDRGAVAIRHEQERRKAR